MGRKIGGRKEVRRMKCLNCGATLEPQRGEVHLRLDGVHNVMGFLVCSNCQATNVVDYYAREPHSVYEE